MNDKIYFDNAATTRVRPEVLEAMLPFLSESCGNPSGIYEESRKGKKAVEEAREKIAAAFGAEPDEIFFTGGGTEADNWAIKGAASAKRRGRIITSAIEHHAVLHTCEYLSKNGFEAEYVPVDADGFVKPADVADAMTDDTFLVSVMLANNEIGTIQPVAEIGAAARERGAYFHTDAVAAAGHVAIDVKKMNIDMLSVSAHKLYGPKGVGALFIRKGVRIDPLLHGGAQERKARAGTENVAGIVGFGAAVELIRGEMERENKRAAIIRDKIIAGVMKNITDVRLNGPMRGRLPGNANFSFDFIEGESLLLLLDFKGICASSGSACTSGSLDPSHVLTAIGLPHEQAHGSLRVTVGRFNTEREADVFLTELPPIVAKLRDMSPLGRKKG